MTRAYSVKHSCTKGRDDNVFWFGQSEKKAAQKNVGSGIRRGFPLRAHLSGKLGSFGKHLPLAETLPVSAVEEVQAVRAVRPRGLLPGAVEEDSDSVLVYNCSPERRFRPSLLPMSR